MVDLRYWVSGTLDATQYSPRFLNYTTDRVRQQQRLKKKASFIRHRTRQTPSLLPPRSGMKLVRRRGRNVKHLRFEDDFDSGHET
jgi:hypothetical protein